MIEVSHFSYAYGPQLAVDDVSFSIPKGTIAALIGPNGAGKSTTMKVLTTLLRPACGKVVVSGFDVVADPMSARRNLGYLPENNPLNDDMIVADALRSMAAQHGMARKSIEGAVARVAASCDLRAVMHKTIDSLSKGYRQRVGIAQAIIHDPETLILDEATTGLDPNQIRDIRDLILEIGRDRTVLISTHILQEVGAIAQRLILMNHGKIACDGPVSALCSDVARKLSKSSVTLEELFVYYTRPSSDGMSVKNRGS